MIKKIIVASSNPVKSEAVFKGFQRMFPNQQFSIVGKSISSNVPDQPIGDHETLQGARNRAHSARLAFPQADYWAGLEGGLDRFEGSGYRRHLVEASVPSGEGREDVVVANTYVCSADVTHLVD